MIISVYLLSESVLEVSPVSLAGALPTACALCCSLCSALLL